MIGDPATAAVVHATFEYAGIALGVALYRRARAREGLGGLTAPGGFAVTVGLLAGAALGNKLVAWVQRPEPWAALLAGGGPGQSIVGGLLGGLLGVEAAKALTGQTRSTGDALVWPLAAGIALGRVGCLLAGLHDDTWGLPTGLPWALDPGDGVPRHPAPLYDAAVVLALAAAVHRHGSSRFQGAPGLAFKAWLAGYLLWRLVVEGLKPLPHAYAFGASGIQWVCALALLAYLPLLARQWRHWRRAPAG